MAKKRSPTTFETIVEARLREAEELLSGFGARVGHVRRDDQGEAIGRHRGGYAKAIPELYGRDWPAPGRIVDAIRRRKGPLFNRVKWAVEQWALKNWPEYQPRQRGRIVGPHAAERVCKACGRPHSATTHRSHGRQSFEHRGRHVARIAGDIRDPEQLPSWVMENPRGYTLVYPATKGIVIDGMRKGPGHPCNRACAAADHRYRHRYKQAVEIFGLPNGDILLRERKAT